MGGTPHIELPVPSFRRRGGGGDEDGEMKERGIKQAGMTGLKSEGCSQQKRWAKSMEFLLPVLKTTKVTTSKRIYILAILVWYPESVSEPDQLFLGSAQLIQLVDVPFRRNVP